MSFPPYDELIDSGINWLGEVPKHWKVVSIKWLSPVQRGASPRPIDDAKYFDDGGEFAWVRIADVSASNDGRLRETTQRLSELGSSLSVKIYPGEIFVSIAGTVGKPCISEIKACIHDGFVYFPHIEINRHFLFRIFEAGLCYGGLGKWGTQLNLNTDTVGSIRIPVPPEDELNAIVEFLDVETSKIDGLVSEQRRLIELLKEKRQAVISHAVTKGLNPNAPMKPSGIQWLGDVPQHWTMKRLKHVSPFICVGIVVNPTNYVSENDNDLPFIYGGDIREGVIDWRNSRRIHADASATQEKTQLVADDLLVVRVGAPGVTAVVPKECEGGNCASVMLMRKGDFNSHWLCYVMNTRVVRFQVEIVQYGAAQKQFNIAHAVNFWVPVPDRTEQVEIAAYLDKRVGEFNQLQAEAERAIELLQERRTALISAAVTGKIDVREIAYQETT